MGKFTAYKLPLRGMAEGEHVFEYRLDKTFFQNMENGDIHDADIKADLKVVHSHDAYTLDFHLTGEVTISCDRCLDAMQWPVDQTYHIVVKYGDKFSDDSDELLEIPSSDPDLNVAYMLHDTVVLGIPIKHVHPMGKCNRQMSALLKRHRSTAASDPDLDLEQGLIDEMETIDAPEQRSSDPRWDALKGLADSEQD